MLVLLLNQGGGVATPWPVDLPQQLQLSNASKTKPDGLVEYAPDAGVSITRLGSTAAMGTLSGYVIVTSAQVASFDAFFDGAIVDGSLPFTFPDPLTGASLLVKFTKQGGMPALQPLGGDNYQLSLVMAILP